MIQESEQFTQAWSRAAVARAPPGELVLVTDFDGTLAEIVQDPAGASARPESISALSELVPLLADVIVLSSRPPAQLDRLVHVPRARLISYTCLPTPRTPHHDAPSPFTHPT